MRKPVNVQSPPQSCRQFQPVSSGGRFCCCINLERPVRSCARTGQSPSATAQCALPLTATPAEVQHPSHHTTDEASAQFGRRHRGLLLHVGAPERFGGWRPAAPYAFAKHDQSRLVNLRLILLRHNALHHLAAAVKKTGSTWQPQIYPLAFRDRADDAKTYTGLNHVVST